MNNTFPEEKREYQRVPFVSEITINHISDSPSGNVLEVQPQSVTATSVDLSEGGILIKLAKASPRSAFLRVSFRVDKYRTINAYGRSIWKKRGVWAGQFIGLDAEDTEDIRHYVKNHLSLLTRPGPGRRRGKVKILSNA